MQRFSLYQGIKGVLVGDPLAKLGQRRFVCQRRLVFGDQPPPREFIDHFEPVDQVCAEHPMLAKAVAAGELKLLAGPVVAADYAQAEQALRAKPKTVRKSGGTE